MSFRSILNKKTQAANGRVRTSTLGNVYRDDRIQREYLPDTCKDDFFLHFDTYRYGKQRNEGSHSFYTMHVIPDNTGYKTKLRSDGDSFYFENETGHAVPSGEWYDGGELGAIVLNYYFTHQDSIPVCTTSAHVDISRWNPLFAIYTKAIIKRMY